MNPVFNFILANLKKINAENVVKVHSNEKSSTDRVSAAIRKHNSHMTNQIGFEGIELTPEELQKMKIDEPSPFKKPVLFTSTACHLSAENEIMGTTSLALEVFY